MFPRAAQNRIPAKSEDSILNIGWQHLGTTLKNFWATLQLIWSYPFSLKFKGGVKLECLHGQYKIVAATKVSPATF